MSLTQLRPKEPTPLPQVTVRELRYTKTIRFTIKSSSCPVASLADPSKAQRLLVQTALAWLNQFPAACVLTMVFSSDWPDQSDEGRVFLDLAYEDDTVPESAV